MIRSSLVLATLAALVSAAPAAAADAAPKDCGPTPSGNHDIHVDAGSKCAFGLATYQALKTFDETHTGSDGFIAAVDKDFKLRVPSNGHKVRLDCRAIARAHGVFDFYCNNMNTWGGTRVVRFDATNLP
ncbi:MAG: hypothetical protein JWM73_2757 [Solirubrobacterales bacterium]|nr:hypothetical protein [Solirubrobacterales bacterium]